ncbi:MAG: hypothetical protein ACREMQ_16580, partial [Longimicrobiales bacterium]
MIFTLIIIMMVGGFILLMPLSRRLGLLVESRIQEKRQVSPDPEIARLTETVQSLQSQVQSLVDRQDFVEHLLQAEKPARLLGEGANEAKVK